MAFVDDFGSVFTANLEQRATAGVGWVPLTLQADDVVTFRYRRPSGGTEDVTAEIANRSRGIATWTVTEGFIDEPGTWEWQAIVTRDGLQLHGQIERFEVYDHLAVPS